MVKRLSVTVVLALLALAVSGCSLGVTSKPSGSAPAGASGGTGASSSAESTSAEIDDRPAIPAESANEKLAVASVGKALKQQIAGMKAGNKQNGQNNYVFENAEGYKPKLIGHQVALVTAKKANGKFGQITVLVLGDTVTSPTQWDRVVGVTRKNGMMTDLFFNYEAPSDPMVYTKAYEPSSAAEKNAVALATAWAKDNVADLGFTQPVKLTGYVFAYGKPSDQPNMLLEISADGSMVAGNGTWPEGYKP